MWLNVNTSGVKSILKCLKTVTRLLRCCGVYVTLLSVSEQLSRQVILWYPTVKRQYKAWKQCIDVLKPAINTLHFLSHLCSFLTAVHSLQVTQHLNVNETWLTADPEVISASWRWFRKNNKLTLDMLDNVVKCTKTSKTVRRQKLNSLNVLQKHSCTVKPNKLNQLTLNEGMVLRQCK